MNEAEFRKKANWLHELTGAAGATLGIALAQSSIQLFFVGLVMVILLTILVISWGIESHE